MSTACPHILYGLAYRELQLEEFQRGKHRMPVLALAATATHQLLQDLTAGLQMIVPQLITDPAHRHNLQYEVRRHGQPCGNVYSIDFVPGYSHKFARHGYVASLQFEHCLPNGRLSKVHAWVELRGLRSSRGLVFVATSKAAEQAAAALRRLGYKAADYHSGMTAADKASVMSDWQAGDGCM